MQPRPQDGLWIPPLYPSTARSLPACTAIRTSACPSALMMHPAMFRVFEEKFTPSFTTARRSSANGAAYPFPSICAIASSADLSSLNSKR